MDAMGKELEKVKERNKDLEYTLRVTAEAQRKNEQSMMEKLERTVKDLEEAVQEKKELREHATSSMRTMELLRTEEETLRREKERSQEQVSNLMKAKTLMQRTLTEQLQST